MFSTSMLPLRYSFLGALQVAAEALSVSMFPSIKLLQTAVNISASSFVLNFTPATIFFVEFLSNIKIRPTYSNMWPQNVLLIFKCGQGKFCFEDCYSSIWRNIFKYRLRCETHTMSILHTYTHTQIQVFISCPFAEHLLGTKYSLHCIHVTAKQLLFDNNWFCVTNKNDFSHLTLPLL